MIPAATMKDLKSKHQKLTAEWKKSDLKACKTTLEEMKKLMIEMEFLPTEVALEDHQQELLLARDVLEIGAQHSIACEDVEAFERYIAQLKTYYSDFAVALPESTYKYELLGLNLLCLLSKNKIADFHTELEQLPSEMLQNNVYINCPVKLEQFIMEGGYNKVLMMKDNVPAESYKFFMKKVLETIRDEIASCMEKAYEQISLDACAKMLQLDAKTTSRYIAARKWTVGKDQMVRFQLAEKKDVDEIPTEELARMAITYAREMEQIV